MIEQAEHPSHRPENLLLCGTNWLGDSVMSMPAVQALKEQDRERPITLLVKKNLVPLWELHPDVDAIIPLRPGLIDTAWAVGAVRVGRFDRACVLSHSVRAALVPFLAWVPVRAGTRGRHRSWLLNRIVAPSAAPGVPPAAPGAPSTEPWSVHQSFEYMKVAGVDSFERPMPRLDLPSKIVDGCRIRLAESGKHDGSNGDDDHGVWVGVIPGAARGRSKRWPVESFARLGRRLAKKVRCRIMVFGSPAERSLCAEVAGACGSAAVDLSGQTTLPELAAFLSFCRVVIANDSGGMHLAAAVGARVVGLFGATDPAVTGPLGEGYRLLQAEGVRGSRRISRHSRIGEESLAYLEPGEVFEAVMDQL